MIQSEFDNKRKEIHDRETKIRDKSQEFQGKADEARQKLYQEFDTKNHQLNLMSQELQIAENYALQSYFKAQEEPIFSTQLSDNTTKEFIKARGEAYNEYMNAKQNTIEAFNLLRETEKLYEEANQICSELYDKLKMTFSYSEICDNKEYSEAGYTKKELSDQYNNKFQVHQQAKQNEDSAHKKYLIASLKANFKIQEAYNRDIKELSQVKDELKNLKASSPATEQVKIQDLTNKLQAAEQELNQVKDELKNLRISNPTTQQSIIQDLTNKLQAAEQELTKVKELLSKPKTTNIAEELTKVMNELQDKTNRLNALTQQLATKDSELNAKNTELGIN